MERVGRVAVGLAAVAVEEEDEVDRLGELGALRALGIEAEAAEVGVELLGQGGLAFGEGEGGRGLTLRLKGEPARTRRAASARRSPSRSSSLR